MTRNEAATVARKELNKYGLKNWGVRISTDATKPFLGMCLHNDKIIVLNAHHIDMHPAHEVVDTILHEIAHVLVGPNHGHDLIWEAKALELGITPKACSHLSLPSHVIDAIRSGATIELEFDTVQVPRYKVTRLQDKCPDCGKPAEELFSINVVDKDGNDCKLITLKCFHILKKIIPHGTAFDSMVSNDWKPEVKSCKHEWNKNQCIKCKEFKLYAFQIVGAKACEAGLAMQKGFGIFDDMGLGKTVQALAIVRFHKEFTPTLYIVKSAVKFQFYKQIVRWLGPDYIAQIITTGKDFVFPGLKSYVISYDLLRRFPQEKIAALGIKLVILDECQLIKNADSARTQEVRKIVNNPTCKVIPLSGTPWKNRGEELFPVLNMIDPVKFGSQQHFLDTWVAYYMDGDKRKMGGIRNISKFKEYTKDITIRREYNEVMNEFPDINRMKLNVQLDALSQDTYNDEVSDFVKWYNEAVIGGEEVGGIELLGKMARMRHITGLAKIPATLAFIEEFIDETDRKLVVFFHHIDVGEQMYDECKELYKDKMPVLKFTGSMNDIEKFQIAEQFNKASRTIMFASTLAAGEGVDLQTCSDSVLHERQWNPQNEDQATPGRFRRIGQLAKVINITVPEAEGTIDWEIDDIIERKRNQFHEVMNKGEMPVWSESSFAKELASSIVERYRKAKLPTMANRGK